MNFSHLKTYTSVFLFFAVLISACCTPALLKPAMSYGPAESRWVRKTFERLSLEEKIGQMICCRYTGGFFNRNSEYLQNLAKLTKEQKVGGFILFLGDVYETAYLTNSLQEMADIPLLIASDLDALTKVPVRILSS